MNILIVCVSVLLPVLIIGWVIFSERHTSRIEREGTPGQALVLSVFDQGNAKGAPIVRFHCSVTPQDTGVPFEGDTNPFVRRTTLASFYVGQVVDVRMNPKKPAEFYIVNDSQIFYADTKHP